MRNDNRSTETEYCKCGLPNHAFSCGSAQLLAAGVACPNGCDPLAAGSLSYNMSTEPFVITERVIRSWHVKNVRYDVVTCDTRTDQIDWESSTDTKIECRVCLTEFDPPESLSFDWE
jgi:hypothetical protein